ncbi:MAG: toll/interleukin-1 receptor domain-containing protein [Sedimentisphaerales bacterium]
MKYITEISRRLATEEYTLIDLTLKQFNLPWTNQWSGNKESYIVEMISNSPDSVLLDLAQHVGYKEIFTQLKEPTFWTPDYFRLFISHVSVIKDYATALQNGLYKYSISAFVAHKDIEPTKEWQNEIELALYTMDAMVALLTLDFHKSVWTDQEVGIAIGRKALVIPVRYHIDPYGFIAKHQALEGKDSEQTAKEIFNILAKHKLTKERMSQIVVNKFLSSGSFQDAKDNMTLLEQCDYFNDESLNRIEKSTDANFQIEHSFGVPERIRNLIRKFRPPA